MKLSKEQALDLVKILTHYQTWVLDSGVANARGLCRLFEEYILKGDEDEEETDEEDEEDDEAPEEDSGKEDAEKSDESEDEEGDEAHEDEEDSDEEELDIDSYVFSGDLHDLKPAKAKIISSSVGDPDDEVTLEFEHNEDDDGDCSCDLLVTGEPIGPITHVKRKGTELHVAETSNGSRAWHRFHVSKFPKGWASTLMIDELTKVE